VPLAGRLRFLAAVLALCGAAFYAGTHFVARSQTAVHPITGRPYAGIATDAGWMDRASRQQEEAPDYALALAGIRPGMVVADVGAGSGYMTLRLAALVGPSGRVYAEDIQPALLRMIQAKAQAAQLSNVTIVTGTDADTHLPPDAVDLALLVDVYHEFQHPQEMLRSIRRALTRDGQLVLIEYRKEDPQLPILPAHRMSVAEMRAEIEPEGFTFLRVAEQLPRQHVVIFRSAPAH
jgi:ubiquinone/menaquinone biosynthesis C-methylase UbiE